MRAQFNTRVSRQLLKRVATDKKSSGVTNDIIAEVALESWFSKFTPEERVRFYKLHDRTPYARTK